MKVTGVISTLFIPLLIAGQQISIIVLFQDGSSTPYSYKQKVANFLTSNLHGTITDEFKELITAYVATIDTATTFGANDVDDVHLQQLFAPVRSSEWPITVEFNSRVSAVAAL